MSAQASELVLRIRRDRRLSQRELAARAHVPQPTIVEIERGNRQPSLPLLDKIARAADFELDLELVPRSRVAEEVRKTLPDEDAKWLEEQLWRYEPVLEYLRDH